jgi:ribosomal protein L11 methyltransferase
MLSVDKQSNWLEVSMSVDGELAEAVAEVIARFAPNGVVTHQAVEYDEWDTPGTPHGPITVTGYIPADEKLEENRQRLEEALWYLGRIQPLPEANFKMIADQNWMELWKDYYHPILIGQKLLVLPAWIEQFDESRIPIRIDPNMAFGTGTHPTTQLCLELVEKHIKPGKPLIDVGCGSGILSIAAIKLGASNALGVDIDVESVTGTRDNARLNQVEDKIEIGKGSVTEILNGEYTMKTAPVVLANILAPIILRLFKAGLVQLVEPGGTLILSGILEEQAELIQTAAKENGLKQIDQIQIKDWVAMTFIKS